MPRASIPRRPRTPRSAPAAIAVGVVDSPFGRWRFAVSERGLCLVMPPGKGSEPALRRRLAERYPGAEVAADARAVAGVRRQLAEYFAGKRRRFDLALDPGGTAFQDRVWRACARIPGGETRSYGELARDLGRPGAARAVGAALAANPLLIVVPCHRVVGRDGSLTGFAGGLALKRALLRLEGAEVFG